MIELLSQPWAWYVGGIGIAFIVFLLLWQEKVFGLSTSLETLCTLSGAGRFTDYFKVDWREKQWLLIFLTGSVIGGLISSMFLGNPEPLLIDPRTAGDLESLGIAFDGGLVPEKIFSWSGFSEISSWILIIFGGLLVGFGTRYAGGCTSGHAISGMASFQLPSLIATIGFFLGGLLMVHFIFPVIF